MSDVALFLEVPDQALANNIAERLKQDGVDAHLNVVDRFPIADSLAIRFAGMRDLFAVVAIFVSSHTEQAIWVLREMLTQRTMLKAAGETKRFVAIFTDEAAIPSWLAEHPDAFISASSSDTIVSYLHDQLDEEGQ